MESTSQPSAAPTPASKRVALLLAVSAALVVIQLLLSIFLPWREPVPVGWFVPAALAFYFGAALSIALLSFGRFLFRKEPYAFWLGLGFWTSALFSLAQLVCLEKVSNSPGVAAAYLFYLSHLALLFPAFYLAAKTPSPKVPSWQALMGRLAWLSLGCILLGGAIFLMESRLPPLLLSPRAGFFSAFLLYVFFFIYAAASWIHWRSFRQTQDPLVGYFFSFLLLCLWVFVGLLLSRQAYDFVWFSSYLLPVIGCLFFYLALLLEYLDFFRELDATVEQSHRHAEIQSMLKEVTQDITALDVDQLVQKLTSKVCVVLKVDVSDVRLMAGGAWQSVGVSGIEPSRLQLLVTGSGLRRSRVVIESRKPVAVEDMSLEAPARQGNRSVVLGFRGYVGVPLFKRNGEVVGVLRVLTYKPRHFSPDDVDLLQQLANGAAIAIENAQLLEEARQKSLHLEALIKVNRDVASLLKKEFLLPSIANEARRFLNVDGASFRLIEGKTLVRAGFAGEEDLLALTPVMSLGESVTGKIVRDNRVIAIKNVLHDPVMVEKHRRILGDSGYHSFLGVPLRLGSRVIGTINLYSKQEREFRSDEIQMITAFADQTAIAVENARLFEELQQKSGELADAFRTKTDFLNTMAHELRTPLNVVIGTQQLLVEGSYGELKDEQSKALERIGRYAQDLLGLINEILDLVRLDARKVPVHTSEFSVREITDDLEISFAPLAREKGLDLKFDIAAAMPSFNSDRTKIREILQNLLANAVKYTEKGKIELTVALQSRNSNPKSKRVLWSVRDTGIGIGQSDLPHLFEPFYMADGVDRRKYPGTGLGLSIVKRLVELLDGDIKIESELGKGSTFTVTFPVAGPD